VRSVAKRVACSKPDVVIYLYRAGDGGLDRVAILLANGFAARGLLTEIWLTHDEGESRFLIAENVTVRMLPQRKRPNRGQAMLFQIPALVQMVRKHQPRILLSAGNQSNLAIAVAAKLGGRTAAFQKITNPIARPKTQNKMQWLRNQRFAMTARLGTRTLVLSEADAQASTILTPEIGHRFIVMPNPYVTDNMLAVGQQRLPRAAGAVPQMLAVARFCAQKDHATLLNALALLIHRSWHLTLVGDGPLRGAIEDQARTLGLSDRITFVGFIKDPLPFYAASDLLILSSRWEGLPATPIEALACGNMVVATDCAPGLSALLQAAGLPKPIPIADPAALANAIAQALDNPPCLDRARQSAECYTIASSVEAHLAAFAPWLSPQGAYFMAAT
jgi:glycosyltransferase involved in cell wall biosynthesis